MRRAIVILSLMSGACVTGAGTAARPTALELQLLGAYEELDDQLASSASVRAGGEPGAVAVENLEALALESRATQRFNEDDILELKAAGCLAETQRAQITARPCVQASDQTVLRRQTRIVAEENSARRNILTWAGYELARRDGRTGPTAKEMASLTAAYQRLLYEAARPGDVLERPGGAFDRAP